MQTVALNPTFFNNKKNVHLILAAFPLDKDGEG